MTAIELLKVVYPIYLNTAMFGPNSERVRNITFFSIGTNGSDAGIFGHEAGY